VPKGSRTTLFVSSTCYDLAQLRADLRDFAESVGLEPVLSELDTFPVNPSQDTLRNCLEAVRTRADLFVLVVGGRYGSINETGKSITNLEYLEAAARGIPKYVFVKRDILSLLPVWRANPNADFRSTVDTPKLLEFVSHLRDKGEVWVFPFDSAQDITSTLRKQLSYLFADCLDLRAKTQALDLPTLQLGPESLRIFVEKPKGWEYLVFAKALQERVRSQESKRLDAELGISFGPVINLSDRAAAIGWVSAKFAQITQTTEHLSLALNSGIEKAVGMPGEPGDIRRIVHLASRIADGYAQALEWTLEFRRLSVEAELEKLMNLASRFSANMLSEIETFSEELYGRVKDVLDNHSPGDVVNFTLTLTVSDTTEFEQEMLRIGRLGPLHDL
jgi:hypothetical protein